MRLDRPYVSSGALDRLGGPRELAVTPGATHLFPEPGALDQVAKLAGHWFLTHFGVVPQLQDDLNHTRLLL